MARVWLPPLMRDVTGSRAWVTAPGKTVGEVIDNLDSDYPGFKDRLVKIAWLDPSLGVWVDDVRSRLGLVERVTEYSEIRIRLTIMGG